MPRKGPVQKREVLPDPIYNSKIVSKLINKIMLNGKKGKSQTILYDAFKFIEKETGKPAMDVFNVALDNIQPIIEVKSQRIGGANYQIPMEVSDVRRETLGLRWLVNYARLRKDKTMELRLAREIMDAAEGHGGAVKKREDVFRMAEANKAFAHYKR